MVSEISAGNGFSRSSVDGRLADSATRVFRVLLANAGDTFDVQDACGVSIGDQHPVNDNLYCTSFDAKFEGESRVLLICTFQYQSTAGSDPEADPQSYEPNVRPANWSISTTVMEVPAYLWYPITGPGANSAWVPIANPVGDMYEGVTRLEPVTTINVEQFEEHDPTSRSAYAGAVNSNVFSIGSLSCFRRSVMFRGVTMRPTVESWGGQLYRGWTANYEFCYRRNYSPLASAAIGWDRLQPQSGMNIKNSFDGNGQSVEQESCVLKYENYKVNPYPNPVINPVVDGKKAHGMVMVFSYENGGASQLPCSQAIPLNDNGTPRSSTASPKVLVYRYQVYDEIDFSTLNVRLS
jgi:hypothetical protein